MKVYWSGLHEKRIEEDGKVRFEYSADLLADFLDETFTLLPDVPLSRFGNRLPDIECSPS